MPISVKHYLILVAFGTMVVSSCSSSGSRVSSEPNPRVLPAAGTPTPDVSELYRAPYEVKITLNRGAAEAASVNAMEIVRVGSFREINRTDESVIFQHFFHVP